MKFDLPKDQSSIIKVFGIGGGGSNAVNHMFRQGIKDVDFIVCNTDQQALDISPVPNKVQLGVTLTEGRGAGSLPEVGKNAAIEDVENIREILEKNTKMVFITAGMGGGTGTGAAPVIAQIAKEMNILTVGIVTMPFSFEGRKRRQQAEEGIEELRQNVDTLLIINNDRLREMYGNLSLANAFSQADDVLTTAAKGIAEVITVTGAINVDFEDVRTVMTNSGVAIMGSAHASGQDRAIKAVENALSSPLLNDNNIKGARYVLLNITYGTQEVLMDEIADITDFIQEESGNSADVIWGHGFDETLEDDICVTIIATGFDVSPSNGLESEVVKKKVLKLEEDLPTNSTSPVQKTSAESKVETTTEEVVEEPYLVTPNEPLIQEQSTIELFNDTPPVQETETTTTQFKFEINSSENEVEVPEKEINNQRDTCSEADSSSHSMEPYIVSKKPTEDSSINNAETPNDHVSNPVSDEEKRRIAFDRMNKLKDLNMKLRTPSGISDLENEPAYKRRNINLEDVPHSSESQASRFTLSEDIDEDGERKSGLSDNNSFLHDNVD